METAYVHYEAELSTGVWTDISADVLQNPAPHFEWGIQNIGPEDLVADVGTARLALNNSEGNSGGLLGYYTPGHTNCRTGWGDGTNIRVKVAHGDLYGTKKYGEGLYGQHYYKWRGKVSSITPSMGRHRDRSVEVGCVDWMDQALAQNIAQLGIQTSKRVDQLIPLVLAGMTIQPRATSYATGVETFGRFFDTDDDQKMSVMSVLQKMARNEYGYIYLKGDAVGGETLRFDSRSTRTLTSVPAFVLDNQMGELEVEYARSNVFNLIRVNLYPKKIDPAATTVLWKLQKTFAIAASATVVLTCPYRDPTGGARISGMNVVDPLVEGTHIKIGTTDDGTSHDIHTFTATMVVGGNSAELTIVNGATGGYVNFIEILGKGIYAYDPQIVEASDPTSIAARGELLLTYNLDQIDSPTTAKVFADYLKGRLATPVMTPKRVSKIANDDATLMAGLLAAEPSTRFAMAEYMTGLSSDYFINGITLDIEPGTILRFGLVCVKAESTVFFIWDTSNWDEAYWAF